MWGLLLGPILAGFYFVTRSRFTKYRYEYLDRQSVLFYCASAGIIALAAVRSTLTVVAWGIEADVRGVLEGPLLVGEASLASALLILLANASSIRLSDGAESERIDPQLKAAIRAVGDELDNILLDAYISGSLLLVTLDNGEAYVVQVSSTPTPRATKYVELFPVLSGYRDERHEFRITTNYVDFYETTDPEAFRLIVELADVMTIQTWDAEVYDVVVGRRQVRES